MCACLFRNRTALIVFLAMLGLVWTVATAQAGDTKFQASATFQLVSSQGTHYVFNSHNTRRKSVAVAMPHAEPFSLK